MSERIFSQRLQSGPTATKSEPIRSCFAHSRPPETPGLIGRLVHAEHLMATFTELALAFEAVAPPLDLARLGTGPDAVLLAPPRDP